MKLILRKSKPEDKDMIRSLLTEAKLHVESLDGNTTTFYMAEENGRLVGMAGFEFYGKDALLRSVAVPAELRRKGIGSVIVDLMLDEARRSKIRRVVLLTETAEDFFSRKGFETVDRARISNADMEASSEFAQLCPKTAVCMLIRLNKE